MLRHDPPKVALHTARQPSVTFAARIAGNVTFGEAGAPSGTFAATDAHLPPGSDYRPATTDPPPTKQTATNRPTPNTPL